MEKSTMHCSNSSESRRIPPKRFDIFKGVREEHGELHKLKTVGSATQVEGHRTFTVYLNTFLTEVFYLVPAQARYTSADYVLMTRQKWDRPGRKFLWKPVGEGRFLDPGKKALHLSFDLFPVDDIYMSMSPMQPSFESEAATALRNVLET